LGGWLGENGLVTVLGYTPFWPARQYGCDTLLRVIAEITIKQIGAAVEAALI
jgi:hypothetical protein